MPRQLTQDPECSAHLAYLYELEGLRLLDETALLDFDRRQGQANLREALSQWRDAFLDGSLLKSTGQHSALHRKMIRFGLSDTFSDGVTPIAFRFRACSILAGVRTERTSFDDLASGSDKPGDLLLRAFLALPDRAEALRLTTLFTSASKRVMDVHRDREAELHVLEAIATTLTFAARQELDITAEARKRVLAQAREAARNHPDAEYLLHLHLLLYRCFESSGELALATEHTAATVLPFRTRQDA